jgi:hypothetical protein
MPDELTKTETASNGVENGPQPSDPVLLAERNTPSVGRPSVEIKEWVDVVNKVAQIVALIAAGLWGLWLFSKTTGPGLVPRVTVDTQIIWTPFGSSGDCQADITVTVKNPGANTIEIHGVTLRIWLQDLVGRDSHGGTQILPPSEGRPTVIDTSTIENRTPDYEGSSGLLEDDLAERYLPNESISSHQVVLFSKKPDALALIQVYVLGISSGTVPWFKTTVRNDGYAIERVCGSGIKENSK